MALYDQTIIYITIHKQNKIWENCPNSSKHAMSIVKLLIRHQMYHVKDINENNYNNCFRIFLSISDSNQIQTSNQLLS